MQYYNVAVIGATGVVGKEFVSILQERNFPVNELYLYASESSLGKSVEFRKKDIDVIPLTEDEVDKRDIDIAFFSAGSVISKQFAPLYSKKGAYVIDNSSAFRMDDTVPLIVPEVNGDLLEKSKKGAIVANPNCSTIQMISFLNIIEELYGIESVVVSTYQSVSGAGTKAIIELRDQIAKLLSGQPIKPDIFPQRIAFNVIPHIGSFYPDGYTQEEKKMIHESRKILNIPDLDMEVTTVRVPVFYGHAESLTIFLKNNSDLGVLRDEIKSHKEFELMDDFESLLYPTPADAGGDDGVYVGRLRYGGDGKNKKRLNAWIVADNVRKGAALNGVEIAEMLTGGKDAE